METIEQHYVDKTAWGPGPWQEEPDRIEWRHSELPCLIVRSDATGALCGYVGCPPGHPFHGADRDDLDVQVHGGLTYADSCDEGGHICHVAQPGEPDDVYWLGFDCGHAFDDQPGMRATVRAVLGEGLPPVPEPASLSGRLFGTYRDIAYVRAEVEALADQVRAAALAGAAS